MTNICIFVCIISYTNVFSDLGGNIKRRSLKNVFEEYPPKSGPWGRRWRCIHFQRTGRWNGTCCADVFIKLQMWCFSIISMRGEKMYLYSLHNKLANADMCILDLIFKSEKNKHGKYMAMYQCNNWLLMFLLLLLLMIMMLMMFNRSWCLPSLPQAIWQDPSAPQSQDVEEELSGTSRPHHEDGDEGDHEDDNEEVGDI